MSVFVRQLTEKLKVLYENHREITSDAKLASHLKCSAGTVADWRNGRKGGKGGLDGSGAGQVPDLRVAQLAQILAQMKPGALSLADARLLWTGDLGHFKQVVQPRPLDLLPDVLRRTSATLDVNVILRGSGLGAIEDDSTLPQDRATIHHGEEYAISIGSSAHADAALTILCFDDKIWQLIAPSHLHGGRFSRGRTRFPAAEGKWLSFSRTLGPQRLYVFVHPVVMPTGLPMVEKLTPVSVDALNGFAMALSAEQWAGRWSWAERVLMVEPAAGVASSRAPVLP